MFVGAIFMQYKNIVRWNHPLQRRLFERADCVQKNGVNIFPWS